jgi:hypothetical protein
VSMVGGRIPCKECGGRICEHGRLKAQCKELEGGSICEHETGNNTTRSAEEQYL